MDKKLKRIFFLGICLFFLIATPTIILYSQGYRFDFHNKKIVQTGAFFFKISPPGVVVNLDQKKLKTTNFFFSNAFLGGLVPKEYQITIEKDGYHPWNKVLKIEEKQVTEAKHIVLFPKNPTFNVLSKNINSFFPAPNGKQIIVEARGEKGWSLEDLDIQTRNQRKIISEQDIMLSEENKKIGKVSLLNLSWSKDSKKILLKISIEGEQKYLVADVSQENNLLVINLENGLKNVSFNPNSSEEIFFIGPLIEQSTSSKSLIKAHKSTEKKAIYRLKINGEQSALSPPAPLLNQQPVAYSLLNNDIFWLTDAGFLYQGGLNGNKIELLRSLNLKPLPIDKKANYDIVVANDSKILLKENSTLYYLDPKNHLFEKVFDSAKAVRISGNQKAIAVNAGNQLQVFYLDKDYEQPQRKSGDKIFLAGFGEEINDLFWLNDFYVIFQVGDSIKISETDNRSKINLIELTTFPQPKIFWDQKQKILLVLSKNNLYSSNDILK